MECTRCSCQGRCVGFNCNVPNSSDQSARWRQRRHKTASHTLGALWSLCPRRLYLRALAWGRGGLASQRPRAFQILVTRARFGTSGCTKQRPIRRVLCRAYVHEGCERWSGGAMGWRPRGPLPFLADMQETPTAKKNVRNAQFFLKDVGRHHSFS